MGSKVFVFLHVPSSDLHVTVKLPTSQSLALSLPFVAPTGYNLGKSGRVTATFGPGEKPPMDLLAQWIDESYRAIAPKKLIRLLPPSPLRPPARVKSARRPRQRPGAPPEARRGGRQKRGA